MDRLVAKRRFEAVGVGIVISLIALAFFAYVFFESAERREANLDQIGEEDLAALGVAYDVRLLDLRLTDATTQYIHASSAEREILSERYRHDEVALADALAEAARISPESATYIDEIALVNDRLVELETTALDLADQGRTDEAVAVLTGEYAELKATYQAANDAFLAEQSAAIRYDLAVVVRDSASERSLVPVLTIAVVLGLTVLWVVNRQRLTREAEIKAHLERSARHDDLTGLLRRAPFATAVDEALEHASRHEQVAVFFLDLDNFKAVNDTRGHDAGDELLELAAAQLQSHIRPWDRLGRLGGDEFVVLAPGLRDQNEAVNLARRLQRALGAAALPSGFPALSASAGVAVSSGDVTDAAKMLANADAALYAAKRAGRNRTEIYDGDLRARIAHRLDVEHEVTEAIAEGQMIPYFQAIVSAETSELVGVETLARWNHPTRGILPPSEFVEIAQDTGFIRELDLMVIDRACEAFAAWSAGDPRSPRLAINVCATTLGDARLPVVLANSARRHGLRPDRITIELTESALLVGRGDAVEANLRRLAHIGVGLALDDFGTGYSSLTHLTDFPIDEIKIDRSFTAEILDNREVRALVRGLVQIARDLGLTIVAEGVEAHDQAIMLRDLGCDYLQGYLFSMPSPLSALPSGRAAARQSCTAWA